MQSLYTIPDNVYCQCSISPQEIRPLEAPRTPILLTCLSCQRANVAWSELERTVCPLFGARLHRTNGKEGSQTLPSSPSYARRQPIQTRVSVHATTTRTMCIWGNDRRIIDPVLLIDTISSSCTGTRCAIVKALLPLLFLSYLCVS